MPTYTWFEICSMAGIGERTFRRYCSDGVLPSVPGGQYDHNFLLRVLAIRLLWSEKRIRSMSAIKAMLASMSDQQVQELIEQSVRDDEAAEGSDAAPDTAPSQEAMPPPPPPIAPIAVQPAPPVPQAEPPRAAARRWTRHELMPGLELMIAEDAPLESVQASAALVLQYSR